MTIAVGDKLPDVTIKTNVTNQADALELGRPTQQGQRCQQELT